MSIRDLHTYYGRVKAVEGISLDVPDGEFLVLLGASGSGKSTLMRTIAGLEQPTSGTILIGDKLANDLAPKDRNISMVFQSYALYPHKTVEKNISFPLEALKTPAAAIREKVDWAAGLFGIGHLLTRRPRELSGGERQRVALARALVRSPSLFLMDEPLSNLDAKLRHAARREFKRLHQETGVTTIYVTHDQVEAMGLGQRVAVMNAGKIQQIGTPHEIYHEPANTFVAQFMGSPPMNLLPEGDVLIGFHPEHAYPSNSVVPDGAYPVSMLVQQGELLGADALVYGIAGNPPTDIIIKLPELGAESLRTGMHHHFHVPPGLVQRFDAGTGLRRR
ncbi:ABC transporter ATP-binding protein [Allopusillimonas soli]|uniref:ABC transporter ATP-binding protein n=1 Tax=Allopusillimonas soli TaxID=659016 RepID=UPI001FD6EA8B|nr:ABC transporter ATP-binding protein [Allopusillimonas soli]